MKLKNLLLALPLIFNMKSLAQIPVANFSMNPNPVCAGSPVSITDMSTNSPTAWSYTFTGGAPATSTLQNPAVTFTAAGTHTVFLIAANGTGTSLPVMKTLTVIATPTVFINPANLTTCIGGTLTFNAFAAGPGAPFTFSWVPTGVTTSTMAVSPTVTTIYTCVVTGTTGCNASRTCTANINPLPTVTITSNPVSLCPGGTATLTATASLPGPFTYTWSTGSNAANITTSIAAVYTATVTNGNGCRGTKSYTLGTSPTLSLTATSNPTTSSICSGNSATLSVTGATSYTWSTGSTFSITLVTPTVTTTYSVIGASGTCTGSTVKTITVNPTPTVTATGSPTTAICSGSSATLSAIGATTYTWNPGALTGANVVVTPTLNTTYTVVGANGNCTNTRTVSINVNPNPTITAVTSNSLLCVGQTATITGGGGLTYTWSTGATSSNIVVSPTVTTSYTVTGSNAFGCSKSFTITQAVSPCAGVQQIGVQSSEFGVFPNPNNGEFTISVKQVIDNTYVEVYNSLGQLINRNAIKDLNTKINLNKDAEGLYHVRIIQDGKSVYNTKMLVN